MRMLRLFTVIAAAALLVSGTAVAVDAAGESDTVQLCRTTKRIGSVPEGTVTWPADGTCPAGTEQFNLAAPSAVTALGERLTVAEAAFQDQSADLEALTLTVNTQAQNLTSLDQKVNGHSNEINGLHEENEGQRTWLYRLEGAVRSAHPVKLTMEVTRDGFDGVVTVTGSGLLQPGAVEYRIADSHFDYEAVDEDGRFSGTFRVDCGAFPVYAIAESILRETVEASAAGCP